MKVLILTFGGDVHNFFTRCVSRDTWGDATFGFVSSKCSGVVLSCFTPSRSTFFTADTYIITLNTRRFVQPIVQGKSLVSVMGDERGGWEGWNYG